MKQEKQEVTGREMIDLRFYVAFRGEQVGTYEDAFECADKKGIFVCDVCFSLKSIF